MKATPISQVRAHGGREALVTKTVALLGGDDETKSTLMGTTNKKLLRVFETANIVKERFGTRKDLEQKILTTRYPKGNVDDGFLKQVNTATLKRLLEIHNQTPAA